MTQDNAPLTDRSVAQGTGVPNTPKGASIVPDATPKEADMRGTPAQRDARPTLTARERYTPEPMGATEAQQSAKEKAETLSSLGPVKSRVQSLVQQRLDQTTGSDQPIDVQANQQYLDDLGLDPTTRANAQSALDNYINNPTPENIQALEDIIGPSGNTSMFTQDLAGQVDEETAIDMGSIATSMDPADAAGLTELIPGWESMSLQEFENAIDVIEAQEFQQVESIKAQLENPNTPPALRAQLLDQLGQLGAAGITGTEEAIDRLDEQLQLNETMMIGGIELGLDDILSDESLSQLIKKAVQDPEYLGRLQDDLNYEDLGEWIERNKQHLETFVGEYQSDALAYDELQNEYTSMVQQYTPDMLTKMVGQDAIEKWFGGDLPDTINANDWQKIVTKLNNNSAFQYFKDNPDELNGPDADNIIRMAERGVPKEKIDQRLFIKDMAEQNPLLSKLFPEWDPLSTDDPPAEVKDARGRTMNTYQFLNKFQDMPIYQDGSINSLLADPNLDISFEDILDINRAKNPRNVIKSLQASADFSRRFQDMADLPDGRGRKQALTELGLDTDWVDLNASLRHMDDETAKAAILSIFDTDGSGDVSRSEFESDDIVQRIAESLGSNPEEIIKSGWNDPDSMVKSIMESKQAGIEKWADSSGWNYLSTKYPDLPQRAYELMKHGVGIDGVVQDSEVAETLSSNQLADLAAAAEAGEISGDPQKFKDIAARRGTQEFFETLPEDTWNKVTGMWQNPESVTDANIDELTRMRDEILEAGRALDGQPYAQTLYHHAIARANNTIAAYNDRKAIEEKEKLKADKEFAASQYDPNQARNPLSGMPSQAPATDTFEKKEFVDYRHRGGR